MSLEHRPGTVLYADNVADKTRVITCLIVLNDETVLCVFRSILNETLTIGHEEGMIQSVYYWKMKNFKNLFDL